MFSSKNFKSFKFSKIYPQRQNSLSSLSCWGQFYFSFKQPRNNAEMLNVNVSIILVFTTENFIIYKVFKKVSTEMTNEKKSKNLHQQILWQLFYCFENFIAKILSYNALLLL